MSSPKPGDLGWFINDFVLRVPEVAHAVVVSTDGLLLVNSLRLPPARAEQLAAVTSGLLSLTQSGARCFEAGEVLQTIVEMQNGYLFLMSISDGSCLAVLTSPNCQMELVAYEMTMLVERVGDRLTPELRAQLASISRN
ncbi:roadblock/LC7 domain-containing protein [Solihabitans fulvus]|uniref:Roadblock/LC7 domain-containing protein n=1 Tax=Solihabitans fulvus TaxID=1892852 RepID=A0A5B2WYD5_9PSEU|nr:roadblock/LC7 domain-containing protein [Solihabitans fulvus]